MPGFSTLALAVGLGLVLFPEPATTATGLALIAGVFGLESVE